MAYEDFFGFNEKPFRLSPDVEFFFPSNTHREALHNLIYSIRSDEAFVQITGEPGIGKTLTLRTLLYKLKKNVKPVIIFDPSIEPDELIRIILRELGIDINKNANKSKEVMLRVLFNCLIEILRKNINVVVMIDEAQNLKDETLEQLRLLSNLETEKQKMIKIILLGQPELEDKLLRYEFRQIYQRITLRYIMKPLSKKDMSSYILHRLNIAGANMHYTYFSPKILKYIYKYSKGVPRTINIICERSLMAAFADNKRIVEKRHLKKAMESISGKNSYEKLNIYKSSKLTLLLLSLLLLSTIILIYYNIINFNTIKYTNKIGNDTYIDKAISPPKLNKSKAVRQKKPESSMSIPQKPDIIQKEKIVKENEPVIQVPKEIVYSRPGTFFIAIDSIDQNIILWQKTTDKSKQIKRINMIWPLSNGIYLLGRNLKNQPFIFNPDFFSSEMYNWLSIKLWDEINKLTSEVVIPVVVSSNDTNLIDKKIGKTIKTKLDSWIKAFNGRDFAKYMDFFHKKYFTFFYPSKEKKVLTREDLYAHEEKIFNKSNDIIFNISDPICILDPANNSNAVCIFYQRISSKQFLQYGIVALYLTKVKINEFMNQSTNQQLETDWKFYAKLWLELK